MKRKYMKPYLAVESFQLNAAIAGACSGKIALNHQKDTCTLNDEPNDYGDYIFGKACDFDIVSPDNADGACYQVFNANDQFLTS